MKRKYHCSTPDDCLRQTCCDEDCFAGARPERFTGEKEVIERRRLRLQ